MINKIIQRLFMHWICIYETNKSTVDWWQLMEQIMHLTTWLITGVSGMNSNKQFVKILGMVTLLKSTVKLIDYLWITLPWPCWRWPFFLRN